MSDQPCLSQHEGLALLTDFYELTMLGGFFKEGKADTRATYEYSFRSLPPENGFGLFAGLEPFLDLLTHFRFQEDDLDYLRSLHVFEDSFLAYLKDLRPGCTIRAIPEGTLVFPHQPILQIEGALGELQLLETALLNFLNFATLIATKAARICLAAEGEPVLEFGLRRAQGPDGGLSGSRAAYIGGCSSTSNVLAGKVYGVPVAGTHAHSWVMSFASELEAFRTYARLYPNRCILLVDTYDTLQTGVPNAIRVFGEMREQGLEFRPGIRLDSGDLAKLSKSAHRLLVEAGFEDPLIVASGDLEENLIADLKRQKAKINAWGVGTNLITSWDAPALNGVYKLMAIEEKGTWSPRIKISSNPTKASDPGRKQVIRHFDSAGCPLADILYPEGEIPLEGAAVPARDRLLTHQEIRIEGIVSSRPLLREVFREGRRTLPAESLSDIRVRADREKESLSEEYKRLRNPEVYRVLLSRSLAELKESLFRTPRKG